MKISSKVKLALRSLLLKCGEVSTDKGALLYDAEALEVGTEVFVDVDGEMQPAPDGEYVDGDKTYVVADGKIAEIREKEAEAEVEVVEAEGEPEAEPADEPEAVEETQSDADRIAVLEATVAELRDGIEALTNAIAALMQRVESVEEKISGLEEPAAEPAEQGEEVEEKFSRLSYLKKK